MLNINLIIINKLITKYLSSIKKITKKSLRISIKNVIEVY